MDKSIAELKERVVKAEALVSHYESLLNSFWTGNVPENASFEHMILASAGKERLAKKAKRAALLVKPETVPVDKVP